MTSLYAFLAAYTLLIGLVLGVIETMVFGVLRRMNDRKTGNTELHPEENHLFIKLFFINALVIFFMYLFRYKLKFSVSAIAAFLSEDQFRMILVIGLKFLLVCGMAFRKRTSGFFLMAFIVICLTTATAYEVSPEVMKIIYPYFKTKPAAAPVKAV